MTDVDINIERPRFPLRSDCDHDLYSWLFTSLAAG